VTGPAVWFIGKEGATLWVVWGSCGGAGGWAAVDAAHVVVVGLRSKQCMHEVIASDAYFGWRWNVHVLFKVHCWGVMHRRNGLSFVGEVDE
jgi:hypothetical protein